MREVYILCNLIILLNTLHKEMRTFSMLLHQTGQLLQSIPLDTTQYILTSKRSLALPMMYCLSSFQNNKINTTDKTHISCKDTHINCIFSRFTNDNFHQDSLLNTLSSHYRKNIPLHKMNSYLSHLHIPHIPHYKPNTLSLSKIQNYSLLSL